MNDPSVKSKKGLVKLIKQAFSGLSRCEEIDLKESYHLHGSNVKVPIRCYPLQINLPPDGKTLHLYPESLTNVVDNSCNSDSFIVFDPETYFREVSGFFRIDDGEKLVIGAQDKARQKAFLNTVQSGSEFVFSILNEDGNLIFRDHSPKYGSCMSPLLKDKKMKRIATWRHKKLKRIRKLFDGNIDILPEKNALALLLEVNRILEKEAFRELDSEGKPGGVVRLPDDMIPVVIGDLHGKVDNLFVILSQNGFLDAMEQGKACLVILGDAVHCEEEGHYQEMESSILTMDVILTLKRRFPKQVFYLRGNHDGFSDEISKGGVAQGLLWKKALNKARGKAYRREMQRFYDLLPYVACSKHMVCSHAAPPTSKVSLEMLVNIRSHAELARELIENRLQKPSRPGGYSKSDVKRLRKLFDLPADTPVIVGHTPITMDDTIWSNVGDIENHFIVYGGNDKWIGVMTLLGERMYPLTYPAEPVVDYINNIADS